MPVYLTHINLSGNELQNAVVQPLATAPANPKLGQIYTDSVDSKIKWYTGTSWKTIGVVVESSLANGAIIVDGVTMTVYTLPPATAAALGGIKIGKGLSVTVDGTLSVTTAENAEKLGGQLPNYYATATAVESKVDKVSGKQLSTNDYTTVEKNKLSGIEAGAQVNIKPNWNASQGNVAEILNKPTSLSAFTNDRNFIDNTVTNLTEYYKKSETYTRSEINSLVNNLSTIQLQVVSSLPSTGSSHIIYLLPKAGDATHNIHEEYLWTGSSFEKIGDTQVDLSNYLLKNGDTKDNIVSFSQSSTRATINTGETHAVLFGKIKKFFTDLQTVAFSGNYNDLSNKPATIKSSILNLSSPQTSNSTTLSGTRIVGVTVIDSITKDIVFCDVDINGMTVTITVASAPANPLQATISYY